MKAESSHYYSQQGLAYLYTIDRVSLSLFRDGEIQPLGNGHVLVFSDRDSRIVLRFIDYYDEELASIALISRSKAWLQDKTTLVFEHPDGRRWRLDCSASDPDEFSRFQDLLTFFIKYENRHELRNVLAMMNPVSCQVTQVIATNVFLENDDYGQETGRLKRPVLMEGSELTAAANADKQDQATKVRLLYQTSDAIMTGSDWIAHSVILAGQALARGIQSQSKRVTQSIEPAEEPALKLSETDRQCIETFYNVNRSLLKSAGSLIGKAAALAASGINYLYNDNQLQRDPVQNAKRHLGVSMFYAAHNVVAGLAMAAGSILASSRDGVVDLVYRKYGPDAGYLAEKAMGGSHGHGADILVYFDKNGVARQVLVGPPCQQPLAITDGAVTAAASEQDLYSHRDSLTSTTTQQSYQAGGSLVFEYNDDYHTSSSTFPLSSPTAIDSSPATPPVHPLDSDHTITTQSNEPSIIMV